MEEVKRNFKDGIFKDYFRDKERLIEAYNAIAGKDYPATSRLEFKELKSVFFKSQNDDVAFMLEDRLIVLLEAQSTINENMPLRMLLYISEIYKGNIDEKALYQRRMSKLPTPEFFVIYYGLDKYPEKKVLKLSDAFICPAGAPSLDLVVTVLNVTEGNSVQMLEQSTALYDYAKFVSIAYKNLTGAKTDEERDEAIKKTIEYCLEHGIMKAYLTGKDSEVRRMLITQWNDEVNREVLLEEGREEGLVLGRSEGALEIARNMKAKGSETTFIMEVTGLAEETISAL